MNFVNISQALELKMILKVLLVLPLPIYFVFLVLALKHLHKSILISGTLLSFIYFLGATEGIVWAYNHYSFFFDPYGGGYQLFVVNFKYHWLYYLVLFAVYLVGAVLYLLKNRSIDNLSGYQLSKAPLEGESKKYQRIHLD